MKHCVETTSLQIHEISQRIKLIDEHNERFHSRKLFQRYIRYFAEPEMKSELIE